MCSYISCYTIKQITMFLAKVIFGIIHENNNDYASHDTKSFHKIFDIIEK
jgi:hypothetical protein